MTSDGIKDFLDRLDASGPPGSAERAALLRTEEAMEVATIGVLPEEDDITVARENPWYVGALVGGGIAKIEHSLHWSVICSVQERVGPEDFVWYLQEISQRIDNPDDIEGELEVDEEEFLRDLSRTLGMGGLESAAHHLSIVREMEERFGRVLLTPHENPWSQILPA